MRIFNDVFESIQGEGINVGRKEWFIRTVGCNMKCVWCDTQHLARNYTLSEVLEILPENLEGKNVTITGGEPLIHDLTHLVNILRKRKTKEIWIETNGSIHNVPSRCFVTMSPKPPSAKIDGWETYLQSVRHTLEMLCVDYYIQLKFPVSDEKDLDWAIDFMRKYTWMPATIQPVDGGVLSPQELAKLFLKKNTKALFIPQIHKILEVK